MPMHYSDPSRAEQPHALPDVETFYVSAAEVLDHFPNESPIEPADYPESLAGWYWWPCFPGCLPDSNPIGPFATEAEALADARANMGEE